MSRMVKRSDRIVENTSLSDLVRWSVESGLNPDTILIVGTAYLWWESPETDEEYKAYVRYSKEEAARLEEKDRAELKRLQEKYG